MVKKKVLRRSRYTPVSSADLAAASSKLSEIAGQLLRVSQRMASGKIPTIRVDGGIAILDAIEVASVCSQKFIGELARLNSLKNPDATLSD